MFSHRERRQADLFFADLMGIPLGLVSEDDAWPDLKSGRVVFYDEDTLRFIEGWTRATGTDEVFLVNRGAFTPIRADGRRRSRAFDDFLRRRMSGERDLQPPMFVMDPSLHTAPLRRGAAGDWDDWTIAQLTAAGRRLTIQPEGEQQAEVRRVFDEAVQAARASGDPKGPAAELVDYFVLDTVRATLRMVRATNVTMEGNHAVIPIARRRDTGRPVMPGTDAALRLIGNLHTHVFLDPLIDTRSTQTGYKRSDLVRSLHSGVSDVDVRSARADGLVVYAVDSKWLHRANPDGTKDDELARSRNVLREALRISGGEPA